MHELERHRGGQRVAEVAAERFAGGQEQGRPEPLAGPSRIGGHDAIELGAAIGGEQALDLVGHQVAVVAEQVTRRVRWSVPLARPAVAGHCRGVRRGHRSPRGSSSTMRVTADAASGRPATSSNPW